MNSDERLGRVKKMNKIQREKKRRNKREIIKEKLLSLYLRLFNIYPKERQTLIQF